jgi:hypothetical protein
MIPTELEFMAALLMMLSPNEWLERGKRRG